MASDEEAATDTETAYRTACATWLAGASARDLDAAAKAQLRDLAARLAFTPRDDALGELSLPRRGRAGGVCKLVASRPAVADEAADAVASLRVAEVRGDGEAELFSFEAAATGAAPEWTKLEVRTTCDGRALIDLRLAVAPLVDDVADVLDLLLALPWLPSTPLFPHVRNRLMEDLLVDLCEIEGSDSNDEGEPCTEADASRAEPPVVRKKAKTST
mmetsp:Transcript_27058/g.83365  ORF Transcript_27058/g.83365 Transcript_27058/m.83365 type:complete len:216 (-) Transcript_27058:13-660(-)